MDLDADLDEDLEDDLADALDERFRRPDLLLLLFDLDRCSFCRLGLGFSFGSKLSSSVLSSVTSSESSVLSLSVLIVTDILSQLTNKL